MILKTSSGSFRPPTACFDKNDCMQKVLIALDQVLFLNKSLFFLPGEGSQPVRIADSWNIEEAYINRYVESYSHVCNPFKLAHDMHCRSHVVDFGRLVGWTETKFYKDFLYPQGCVHGLQINLRSKTKTDACIGLFKSEETGGFSSRDLAITMVLVPYLTATLKHVELVASLAAERDIQRAVAQNLQSGVIILDDSMSIIHVNERARKLLWMPDSFDTNGYELANNADSILPGIKEDCLFLRNIVQNKPFQSTAMPVSRTLKLGSGTKCAVSSRVLPDDFATVNPPLYIVEINEVRDGAARTEFLREAYRLTRREIEIAEHVCDGFANAQIAARLFIDETTVKKHVQHIFDKTGVNSRTALMCKIMNSP